MKNKELQEQRIKGYFLQATKDLLKSEGIKSVNVRSIAERAGYSYTTMYNYFRDINDLIFHCVRDFYQECQDHVKAQVKRKEKGLPTLQAAIKAYAGFFIQYPGIFDLFFLEEIAASRDKKAIADLIGYSLDSICEEEWTWCMSRGVIAPEQIASLRDQIRHSVYGLLLLYLNRGVPSSYAEFTARLNTSLQTILQPLETSTDNTGTPGPAIHNSLISINVGNNR